MSFPVLYPIRSLQHSWEHWLSPAQHSSILLSSLWESSPVAAGFCVPQTLIQHHQPSPLSLQESSFSLESASLPSPDRQGSVRTPKGWEHRESCRGIPASEGLSCCLAIGTTGAGGMSSEILQHWSSSAGRWQKALDGGNSRTGSVSILLCIPSPAQGAWALAG